MKEARPAQDRVIAATEHRLSDRFPLTFDAETERGERMRRGEWVLAFYLAGSHRVTTFSA